MWIDGEDQVAAAYIACQTDVPFEVGAGVTVVYGWETWDLDDRG